MTRDQFVAKWWDPVEENSVEFERDLDVVLQAARDKKREHCAKSCERLGKTFERAGLSERELGALDCAHFVRNHRHDDDRDEPASEIRDTPSETK